MKVYAYANSLREYARILAVAAVGVAAACIALPAAQAQVVPTVSAEIRNASNNTITSSPVGAMVHLRAVVASSTSSTSPQGTVDFIRYEGATCSGTGTSFESNTTLNGGVALSDAFPAQLSNTSFRVHYDGQGDMFAQATSSCVSLQVTQFDPALALSLSSSTIHAGTSVYASSTLSSATSTADGTLTYRVYTNNSCTNLYAQAGVKTVTNTNIPGSDAIQFNTPGTYYWQGVYSGDAENEAATSTCSSGMLTVLATSSTPTTTGNGTISGTVYHDKNGNRTYDSGDTGLSGFTVWLFKLPTKHYKAEYAFKTAVSDTNGNYSFANLPDGTYRVELHEQKKNGWNQKTSDYKSISIQNGSDLDDIDFGNASTTGKGKDKDKDDDKWRGGWWSWGGWVRDNNASTSVKDFLEHLREWKWNWR